MKNKPSGVIWLVLALALVALMPTNQSLWIDEGFTLPYAQEGSFSNLISRLENEKGSESLMPLGMLSSWAGAKIFGRSELGLRAVSALWAAVAVLLFWRIGALIGIAWLPALLACHPFLWYYASEVRPYAMVIAMASGLLYAFVAILSPNGKADRGFYALLAFGPLLCATYVLGAVPFAIAAGVAAFVLFRRGWKPQPREIVALVLSAVALVALGLYEASALSRGGDIHWEGPWKTGLGSLLFAGYELLGFMGFGPGRVGIRQAAVEHGTAGSLRSLANPAGVGLVVLALLYVVILLHFWKRFRSDPSPTDRLVPATGFVIAGTVGIVFVVSLTLGSVFWGRRVASVLPFVVLAIGIAANVPRRIGQTPLNVLPLLLGATLLTSSLLVRFNPKQGRDDYRGAARLAQAEAQKGKTVWWAADRVIAEYYNVLFCGAGSGDQRACVVRTANRDSMGLEHLPKPDMIVLSKPELSDTSGAVRKYIGAHRFRLKSRLMAFEVFQAP
jgi:hypothetical protein